MDKKQQETLKQSLLQEKEAIHQHQEQNRKYGLENPMNDSIGELSGYDNHPADIGTELFERGKDLALQDNETHRLEEIDDALKRLEEGTYGVCVVCGNEIPYERLEALPWTRYCQKHSPDQHSSERRPKEEAALKTPTHSFQDDQDYNGFDGEDAWQEVERYGTSNPPDFFPDAEDYEELWIDSGEQRGYVDLTEGFAITDLDGRSSGLSEITHNEAYRRKMEEEYEGRIEG